MKGSGRCRTPITPVDKCAEDATLAKIRHNGPNPGNVEGQELRFGHLARSHLELTMSAAGDVASDWNVVRSDRTRDITAALKSAVVG